MEVLGRTRTLQKNSGVPPGRILTVPLPVPFGCELAFVIQNRVLAKYHYGSIGIIQISAPAGKKETLLP